MSKKLPFDACAELLNRFADDFLLLTESAHPSVPQKQVYKITAREESTDIVRSARIAAFKEIDRSEVIIKNAFDTRRIDQEHTRNPRENLQYWSRSDQFIDENDQAKLDIFSKLIDPLKEIKNAFGSQPEYFNSYAKNLYDSVHRIMRIGEADQDLFRPQLAYLEQLMYARYRLSMEQIATLNKKELTDIIIKKDESLLKRGAFLHMTQDALSNTEPKSSMMKDGNALTQDSIVNAIFGNNNFRRDGEQTVERTITITIRDQVID